MKKSIFAISLMTLGSLSGSSIKSPTVAETPISNAPAIAEEYKLHLWDGKFDLGQKSDGQAFKSDERLPRKPVDPNFLKFLAVLKHEVVAKDWEAVSNRIKYPIKVFRGKGYLKIRNAAELKKKIKLVFNRNIQDIVRRQTEAELVGHMRNYGFWSGTIWTEKYDGVYLIKNINNNLKWLENKKSGVDMVVKNMGPEELDSEDEMGN